MAVTLTESAAKRVEEYLAKGSKGVGLRLGVKTAGCSGLAYDVAFADQIGANDEVFESHGVKVVVDKDALQHVDGTEIDFVQDGFNQQFTFNNPQVTGQCGCGESFSTTA